MLQQSAVEVMSEGSVMLPIEGAVGLVEQNNRQVILFHEAAESDMTAGRELPVTIDDLGQVLGQLCYLIDRNLFYI